MKHNILEMFLAVLTQGWNIPEGFIHHTNVFIFNQTLQWIHFVHEFKYFFKNVFCIKMLFLGIQFLKLRVRNKRQLYIQQLVELFENSNYDYTALRTMELQNKRKYCNLGFQCSFSGVQENQSVNILQKSIICMTNDHPRKQHVQQMIIYLLSPRILLFILLM